MIRRRVKFVWGASKVIRGIWYLGLFGFYERIEGVRDSGLAISVRGLLAWGAVATLLLYVGAATAVHAVWDRNPHSVLTWTDAFLYPVRRGEVARKQGQAFLAEGKALARQNRWGEASKLLRLGLARVPDDNGARLQLARFYILANQRVLAVQVLQGGLGHGYPGRSYLDSLFAAAEEQEDHGLVIETVARYLPQTAGKEREWLDGRRFAALLAAGRAEEALTFARAELATDRTREQMVLALLELRRPAEALATIEAWSGLPGSDRLLPARLRVRTLRELGRAEEMGAAIDALFALAPTDPAALVFGVVQQLLAGQEAAAAAALEHYLFRFGGSASNLLLAAEPIAEVGHLVLLQRCVDAAKERGYPLDRFQRLQLRLHLRRGEWETARELLRQTSAGAARESPTETVWREWVSLLVKAANSSAEPAQLGLVEWLRSRSWSARIYRDSVEAMLKAGRTETAREILTIGQRAFPHSRSIADLARRQTQATNRPPD